MKRRALDWKAGTLLVLYGIAVSAVSAYVATRYVSPCICIYAGRGLVN